MEIDLFYISLEVPKNRDSIQAIAVKLLDL